MQLANQNSISKYFEIKSRQRKCFEITFCLRQNYRAFNYRDFLLLIFFSRSLLQDVSNTTADVCDSSVGKRKLVVTWGQSVHLGCFVKMPEVLANQEVRWYHYSKEKGRYQIAYKYGAGGDKFIETSEKGLVIVGVNEQDAGRYDCWLGGALLCSYNITVDAHRCSAPAKSNDYQKIYSDWCHEFEKYKSAMKSWERKQAVSRLTSYSFLGSVYSVRLIFLYMPREHFYTRAK